MNRTTLEDLMAIPWYVYLILAITLLIQGTWLFIDARKKGHRSYWFWGLWGMISIPLPTILYLIFTKWISNKQTGGKEE